MTTDLQRLQVFAYLILAVGCLSWLQFLYGLGMAGSIGFGIELILLPAGLGLIRREDFWRKISITIVLLAATVVFAVPVLGYTVSPVMSVRIHGIVLDPDSLPAALFVFLYAALLLCCFAWVIYALNRDEIKDLFQKNSPQARKD